MACPYFMPAIVSDRLRAARAPLGGVYAGACHSGPAPAPPADEVIEYCNFGYGRDLCPLFPASAVADAVRFTYHQGKLIYVLEREYSPIEHGATAGLDPSSILAHQAAIFAANTHS